VIDNSVHHPHLKHEPGQAVAYDAHDGPHRGASPYTSGVRVRGANCQFPIPVAYLTLEQLTGLVRRGLLVVALPPGQNVDDWEIEILCAVATAGLREERDGRTAREKQK